MTNLPVLDPYPENETSDAYRRPNDSGLNQSSSFKQNHVATKREKDPLRGPFSF